MDLALDIVERCVLRLVCLCISNELEETVGILTAGHIVVDEADEDSLALRELYECFLKDLLAGLSVAELLLNVGELGVSVTVVTFITVGDALLEASLCRLVLTCTCSSETCIVQCVKVNICAGNCVGSVECLLEILACS